MYYADDYPTQELTLRRPGRSRHWMVMGGAAAALLVLLLALVVACRGSGDRPLVGAGSDPTATATTGAGSDGASPDPAGGAGEGPAGGGNGPDGGGPGGGDGGGGDGGGDDGGGDDGGGDHGGGGGPGGDPDPEPEPLAIEVRVADPPPAPGCAARGTIEVTGGEYPLDLTFLWFRMKVQGGGQPPSLVPYGPIGDTTLTEPGELAVTSVDFPELASVNGMQLRVVAPDQAVSELVSYPKCTELGISP